MSQVNPANEGTKTAPVYKVDLAPGQEVSFRLRLRKSDRTGPAFGPEFDQIMAKRLQETTDFYVQFRGKMTPEEGQVSRQAAAGLIWTQQFFYYHVRDWLKGDPAQPSPPAHRTHPNQGWEHLFARDILSMPDKWEFPWFAVWDTAFHMIPYGDIDPEFAKHQLLRFLRDWYQHPNGQIPAYEFNFSDVNPPVHAWACRRVYERDGRRDRRFLTQVFNKLCLNFTWWVNRKDYTGNNLFSGGFLGLDNIGVFDRSKPLPIPGHLEQADGTAWMAFYCAEMLNISLELAKHEPAYEDMACKFLEHYCSIVHSINTIDGTGLWDEQDGFYYDSLHINGELYPLRLRSMVGLIPLFGVELLSKESLEKLPAFRRRLGWFVKNRPEAIGHLDLPDEKAALDKPNYLLSLPNKAQLERLLKYVFDEDEFLSAYGIRSMSRHHKDYPFTVKAGNQQFSVGYLPSEDQTGMFGGNSNWRGPIWFPVNYLIVESLRTYGEYYGDSLKVEFPTGTGQMVTLLEAADLVSERLTSIFLPDANGRRACHGDVTRYTTDPLWKELVLFYEYYHGDTGRGCGANHQTGWSALVASLIRDRTSQMPK
jgi:hypothetical protein